jgi:ABC-type uncharacterized transport system permease subunit
LNVFVQAMTVLLPSAYLMAAVVHGMAFAGEREPSFAPRARPILLWSAVGLHGLMFAARWQVAGAFPVAKAWMLLSATAWVVAILFALITWRVNTPSVGGIVLAMVAGLQGLASAFGPVRAQALPPADAGLLLHVVTVVLASAALVLSGLFGFLHLILYRQMRRKSFGPVYRELPDLEQLGRLTRRAALVGFVMLTAGLNVGIGMAHARSTEGFDYLDPHVLLTIVVWLHFGLISFSRRLPGLTARRTSIAAVIGLVTLLLTIALTLVPAATFHRLG